MTQIHESMLRASYADSQTESVEQLFERVRQDRVAVVAIANALLNISAIVSRSSAAAKIVEDLQWRVKLGVTKIVNLLTRIEGDLCEVTRFKTLLESPVQDLLDAQTQMERVLSVRRGGQPSDMNDEATGALAVVSIDQNELKFHILNCLDVILENSCQTLIKLENMIDDLQLSFAKLSVSANKR